MDSKCVYTIDIDGKKVSMNLMQLTEHYYKTTDKLKKSAIYSSDEKIEATKEILHKFITEEAKETLKLDETKTIIRDYITKELPLEVREALKISEQTRLNPEYIEENRIKEYIKNHINLGEDTLNLKDHPLLSTYMENPELTHLDRDKVNYYLHEIVDIITLEEKVKGLGISLHKALQYLINYEGDLKHSVVALSINAIYEDNKDILDGDKNIWINKFKIILNDLHTNLTNYGYVMSEIPIGTLSDGSIAQVKGTLDVVAINDNGDPQIFDFKLSKKPFSDWDSVKLQQTDWELILYRQLLGQYMPIVNTTINVIPLEVGEMTNGKLSPHNFILGSIKTRAISNKFETIAQKLIPRGVFTSYDPARRDEFLTNLKILFGQDYEIKTSQQENDIEKLVRTAKRNGKWNFTSIFDDLEGIKKGYNVISDQKESGELKTELEKESEFRKKMELYIARVKEDKTRNVRDLKNKIVTAIASEGKQIEGTNEKQQVTLNKVLKDYIIGTHKVIDVAEEVTALGFILLQNIQTGSIVVINISAHNQLASTEFDNTLTYLDVEYIKTFSFLSSFYYDLGLDKTDIEDILIYNLEGHQLGSKDFGTMFELYKDTIAKKKIVSNNLTDNNIPKLETRTRNLIRNLLRTYKGGNYNEVESIFKSFFDTSVNDMSYEKALSIEAAVIKAFPHLKERTLKPEINFDSEIEYLYTMLQTLILVKSGQLFQGDFAGMRDFSIAFSDFKSLFASLYTKDKEEYTKDHKKITGIMGSLLLVTPDKMPSSDLRSINKIIQITNNLVRQKLIAQSNKLGTLTRDFYEKIGYSDFEQNFWGKSRDKYKNMFRTDSKGEVSEEMRTKNPYSNDPKNLMTDAERTYLKHMLLEIQKYMLDGFTEADAAKVDVTSLETIEKTDKTGKIIQAILSDKYFRIPLIRSEQVDKYGKVMFGGIQGLVTSMKEGMDEFNSLLNPRELLKDDLSKARATQIGLHEMYDVYGNQTDQSKLEAIKRHKDMNYWELNLDTIAHHVAFNKIRKNMVDQKLPIIKAYIWTMKLTAGKVNEDISKELKYIEKQLNLGLFDEKIIDKEFEDVTKVAAAIKRITTFGMLALRPVLMAKELTIGLFKGFSLASTKMFGTDLFDSKSLGIALTKLATIDKKFSQEWNLIDRLNHHYAFANLDMGSYTNRIKTDRRGIMKGLGPWLYAFNTIPDYYNRMALFIAKMIYDGSYDAHTLVDNELLYDPSKDKRFSYYFANREKHKDSKGNYLPAPKDEEYNKQRNLYILLVQQLNSDRAGLGEQYTEKDKVNQAYSELERNSFKSLTDTAYGYYDKDAQSQLHNTAFGVIFLQFMQYWPSKMQLWFGKSMGFEGDKTESPIGKYVQKTRKDENGEVKLLWRKPRYDPDTGEFTHEFDEVFENTSDPVWVWEGIPQEGLAIAVFHTIQDVLRGKGKEAFADKARIARVEYAMIDAGLMVLFWGFIVALIKGYAADFGDDSVGKDLLRFAESVSSKVLNEQNLFDNTLGAINTEPAFYSYTTRVASDIGDLIMGDKSFRSALSKNLKMFEFIRPE